MSRGWEEVRADLAARIRAREWAPGARMPGEVDLAAFYGVARATVSRAVSALAEAGLVARKRRDGTRVSALPTRQAHFRISVIRQEVEAQGLRYSHAVLFDGMRVAPMAVTMALDLPAGLRLRRLETLHLAAGAPFAQEVRWLNMAALPPGAADFAGLSANEWLVANVPILRGTLAFTAEAAGAEAARALRIDPGAATFVTERATFGEAGGITWVRVTHRPGWRVETELQGIS